MPDPEARQAVLDTLGDEAIDSIRFRFGRGYSVAPALYDAVAGAVSSGRIAVRHDEGLDRACIYNSTENRIYLRFDSIGNTAQESAIVHEATHAGFDIRADRVVVSDSEAAAYIAQCIYARRRLREGETRLGAGSGSGREWRARDRVFQHAWRLAGMVIEGNRYLDTEEMAALRSALAHHPWYGDQHLTDAGYDGVPGVPREVGETGPTASAGGVDPPSVPGGVFRRPESAGHRPSPGWAPGGRHA